MLQSVKLSFLVNGKVEGYFSCKRGVRQRDPLSPLLFCLVEDVLSRGITQLVDSNSRQTIAGPRNLSASSHILYADDVLVFCKAKKSCLEALMDLFNKYSQVSGQHLSPGTYRFYSGSISASKSAKIASIIGFAPGSLPFIYLGVPLFKRETKENTLARNC